MLSLCWEHSLKLELYYKFAICIFSEVSWVRPMRYKVRYQPLKFMSCRRLTRATLKPKPLQHKYTRLATVESKPGMLMLCKVCIDQIVWPKSFSFYIFSLFGLGSGGEEVGSEKWPHPRAVIVLLAYLLLLFSLSVSLFIIVPIRVVNNQENTVLWNRTLKFRDAP